MTFTPTAAFSIAELRTRQTPLLEQLGPEGRKRFLDCCQERYLSKNTILFHQGEPHVATYLIQSGLVRTYYLADNGREVTLAYWSEGDLIGGPDFFGVCPHIWCAKVMERARVFAISGPVLRSLSSEIPELSAAIIESLTFKTHWLSVLVQMHYTQPVPERLTHLLVKLDQMYGINDPEGRLIRYRFTQEELANMVGASRQWVCHVLHDLETQGLLSIRDRYLVLRNPDALAKASTTRY